MNRSHFRCRILPIVLPSLAADNTGWSEWFGSQLGCKTEQVVDKVHLPKGVTLGQPLHSFDHVHCFDSVQRAPRGTK